MDQLRVHATLLTQRATMQPPRLGVVALLVLAVTVAACGAQPTGQANQGPTSVPTTVAPSAIACDSPAQPAPTGGCVVQDAATGISLRVATASADATMTAVQLETSNPAGHPIVISKQQLALASGGGTLQQITENCGDSLSCFTITGPVAPADSAPLAHFVASAHFRVQYSNQFQGATPTPTPGWASGLDQLALSVPFALAPVRSRGDIYQQAPAVKQGIGVQVQWLQVAPAANTFYGPTGGASIELRFSGLPADMELLSFLRIAFENHISGGTTWGNGPGSVGLHIPGMSVSDPAFTILQSPQWPDDPQVTSEEPTIGAAGTAQLEVVFQGSGIPTGQPATVSISNIQLLTGGIDGNSGNPPMLPSFQITLPLS